MQFRISRELSCSWLPGLVVFGSGCSLCLRVFLLERMLLFDVADVVFELSCGLSVAGGAESSSTQWQASRMGLLLRRLKARTLPGSITVAFSLLANPT